FEMVGDPRGPILVELVVKGLKKGVVAGFGSESRQILQVAMANLPAPDVVGTDGEDVVGFFETMNVNIIAGLRSERQPRKRPEVQVRIEVRKLILPISRVQAPIGVKCPVN